MARLHSGGRPRSLRSHRLIQASLPSSAVFEGMECRNPILLAALRWRALSGGRHGLGALAIVHNRHVVDGMHPELLEALRDEEILGPVVHRQVSALVLALGEGARCGLRKNLNRAKHARELLFARPSVAISDEGIPPVVR